MRDAPLSRSNVVARTLVLVIAAATFVILRVALPGRSPAPKWETNIISAARHHPPPWAHVWTDLFDRNAFVLLTLGFAGIALLNRRRALAVAGTVGCAAAVLAAEHVFKQLMDGYPSAHVTAAAAIATFAWCVASKRPFVALGVFVVPLLVGWAVIAQRMHAPSDVFGGLLLGTLVVSAIVFVTLQSIRRFAAPQP